jgi:hypothetical protein
MKTDKTERKMEKKTCEMNILIYFSLFANHLYFARTKERLEENPESEWRCTEQAKAAGRENPRFSGLGGLGTKVGNLYSGETGTQRDTR